MSIQSARIIGHWKTKTVSINGKAITPARFYADLKAAQEEPGDNQDIIDECQGVAQFSWGEKGDATYCLALACCFYLHLKWVMCRFFDMELEKAPQGDITLFYDNEALDAGYLYSEELFAKEFTSFMKELGAVPVADLDPDTVKH
jgi:hypothetical protein